MTGKLGGVVYTLNRQGTAVRTRVTPSNPKSTTQTVVRSICGFTQTEKAYVVWPMSDLHHARAVMDGGRVFCVYSGHYQPGMGERDCRAIAAFSYNPEFIT